MDLISLRKNIKEKRLSLSSAQVSSLSEKVFANFFSLEFILDYSSFFVYNAFKNEVDTKKIILKLKELGKIIAHPITIGNQMVAGVPLLEQTKKGNFGIIEPTEYKVLDSVEVAVCPLLACDKKGNRVGFGKGFYDKFLSGKNIIKIGLAYDFQVVDALTPNSYDVPLDYILTPTQIIKCN